MTTTVDELRDALGPLRLPREFVPVNPTIKQEVFLRQAALEVFGGGAAGPGKSWSLLMAAAQFVDVPGYNAIIFRTVLQDHYKRKALIPTSHEWFGGTDATWNGSLREWTFPSGATIGFSYARNLADVSHFKGPAYALVAFDELTEFNEQVYRSMFRLLRDPPKGVPLRMRSASNPGGPGADWVKTRFITPESREKGAVFIPATIHDNPHMNYEEYLLSLSHLSPIDQARLINGDWDASEAGGKFDPDNIPFVDHPPAAVRAVRYWDLAATEPSPQNTDPDWAVGLRLEVDAQGLFTITDINRGRWGENRVEAEMQQTALLDGPSVPIYVEQEPGSAGKLVLSYMRRQVLSGYAVHAGLTRVKRKPGELVDAKEVRARPVAAAVANGLVRTMRCRNILEALDELRRFPYGVHDDIVDALSGAHTALTRGILAPGSRMTTSVPTGRLPSVQDAIQARRGM